MTMTMVRVGDDCTDPEGCMCVSVDGASPLAIAAVCVSHVYSPVRLSIILAEAAENWGRSYSSGERWMAKEFSRPHVPLGFLLYPFDESRAQRRH